MGVRLSAADFLAAKPGFRQRLRVATSFLEASRRYENRRRQLDESTHDALLDRFRTLLDSDRFRPYRDHHPKIAEGFKDLLIDLESRVETARSAVTLLEAQREKDRAAIERMNPRIVFLRITAVTLLLAGIGGLILLYKLAPSLSSQWRWTLLSIPPLVIFGSIIIRAEITKARYKLKLQDDEEKYHIASLEYEQQLDGMVEEACTRAINDKLGPTGLMAFPTKAPRLIELRTSAVIPFRSLSYLREFIEGHDSSAIGVAGPRGSGKTTLLNALKDDKSLTPHSVSLTAPVHYDTADFIRRLYLDVARMIDRESGQHTINTQPTRTARVALSRAILAIGAIFVGLI